LHDARPQLAGMRLEAMFKAAETEESLVDGIEFKIRCEIGKYTHHACTQIAVEAVVTRAHMKIPLANTLAHDMPRFAHDDAEGFRLIGARDHAAVVV
jgi:hypothetical protein